jgi:hypothetical protein
MWCKAIVLNSIATLWHIDVAKLLDTKLAVYCSYNRGKIGILSCGVALYKL